MKRLLPLRVTDQHDVVNMFALSDEFVNQTLATSGFGDEGVFVKIVSGDLNQDTPVVYGSNPYLGKTDYKHVYNNFWPSNPLKVAPANSGDGKNVLGITLYQTAYYDENGEKLLTNSTKAAENFALVPGQSVPVLRRGQITLSQRAIDGTLALNSGFKLGSSGKVIACALTDAANLGTVIGTGSRPSEDDAFAGFFAFVDFNCGK